MFRMAASIRNEVVAVLGALVTPKRQFASTIEEFQFMTTESIQKLKEAMGDAKFCMFTTVEKGGLRSRPMTIQQAGFDGDLWFFMSRQGDLSDAIAREGRVNLSIVRPGDNVYVSISGRARLVDNRPKTEELWSDTYKAWFSQGIDDPDLQLMVVEVAQAEYWDAPSTPVVLFRSLKAAVTGHPQDMGVHEKLTR